MSKASARFLVLTLLTSTLMTVVPPSGAQDVGAPFTPIATVYQEDFELGAGGWGASGGNSTWALGTPTPAGGPDGAYSGLNAWGTNLSGLYKNNDCSFITGPAVELPGAGASVDGATVSAARAAFRHWVEMENRYDGGVVQVSANGGANWTTLQPLGGYPVDLNPTARRCLQYTTASTPPAMRGYSSNMSRNASDWLLGEVDLTAFLGQTVQLRFAFGTDSSVVKKGWAIDDVVVQVGAGALVSPEPPGGVGGIDSFVPLVTHYAEDFELGAGGWAATGITSWALGTPTYGPDGAYSGTNAWATNPAGNHSANECGRLVGPSIALPGVGAQLPDGARVEVAQLFYRQWFVADTRADGGLVQVSTDDGATWTTIAIDPAYNNTASITTVRSCLGMSLTDRFQTGTLNAKPDEWTDVTADLTPFLGSNVRFGFAFATSSVTNRAGWYVDDVAVLLGAGVSVDPDALVPTLDPNNMTVPYEPLLTAYEETFDSGLAGWTPTQLKVDVRALKNQYNDSWQRGAPSHPAGPLPTYGSSWKTNLTGFYHNNECNALVSPAIDLAAVDAGSVVRLDYKQWYKSENAWDAGVLEVSENGGAWQSIAPIVPAGYPVIINNGSKGCLMSAWSSSFANQVRAFSSNMSPISSAWLDAAFDLSAYAGDSVRLRYRFSSDPSVNSSAGWAIDNVVVTDDGAPIASFDFESGDQGWTHAPTPIPLPLSWEAGSSSLATRAAGNYSDGECTAIESPSIDLTTYPPGLAARLVVDHARAFGTGDYGLVQMSVDGGAWTDIAPEGGYNATAVNSNAAYCFSRATSADAYSGSAPANTSTFDVGGASGHAARFRFFLAADNSTAGDGWTIDHVRLDLGVGGSRVGDALPGLPGPTFAPRPTLDGRLKLALLGLGPHAEDELLDVVIGGPAHAVPDHVGDRAAWNAYFAAASEPFFEEARAHVAAQGGVVTHEFPVAPALVASLPRDAVLSFSDVKGVERLTLDDAESVRLIEPEIVPEGEFDAQNAESVPMTQAPEIWALGYRGQGMKLAVIDTGVFGAHPALLDASCVSRVTYWKDFIANQSTPYDDNGHGTHVSGTSAGSTACGGRANGVAPDATIMGVKFLSSSGSGSFANGMASLQWAFDNGADVTTNSWGSSCSASLDTLRLVNNLARAGMPSAFAAGNSGPGSGTVGGPACADMPISVAATDKNMVIASFSSRGPCSDLGESGPSRICPDVAAVGFLVVSSVPTGSCTLCNPTGYRALNGTSMATPHVGGALILMTQFKRALTGLEWDTANKAEETALKLTALDLGAAGEDNVYGAGFIQLLPIYNLIANPGVPDIRDVFLAPSADMRVGNSAPLAFRVSNAGTRAVTGHLTVTLTTPDGPTVLAERDVTLDFGGAAGYAGTFTVATSTAAGTYALNGDFVYSWVDDDNVTHVGEVHRTASWLVKKIDVRISRVMPASSPVGVPFDVVITVENRGNEDATNLTYEETVRDAYLFVPCDPDPFNLNFLYACPPPNAVREDNTFGRTTLVWNVGDFPAGSSTQMRLKLVPLGPPATYPFTGLAKYKNEVGQSFIQGATTAHTITLG